MFSCSSLCSVGSVVVTVVMTIALFELPGVRYELKFMASVYHMPFSCTGNLER